MENSANPNYVRRKHHYQGAIVETPEGNAKVTPRPGQDAVFGDFNLNNLFYLNFTFLLKLEN